MIYINEALKYLGVPYKNGGMSMKGIDCSGLINVSTGQTARVWHTSSETPPPGKWLIVEPNKTSHDSFISKLKRGDLLLWKGHAAFYFSNTQIFHARKPGTLVGFTNDLKKYWLEKRGYPIVYRQTY